MSTHYHKRFKPLGFSQMKHADQDPCIESTVEEHDQVACRVKKRGT